MPDGRDPVCSLVVWCDSRLVIFDCDGVLVDSEVISNRVLAEMLSAEGLPTTLAQARRDYQGLLQNCGPTSPRLSGVQRRAATVASTRGVVPEAQARIEALRTR